MVTITNLELEDDRLDDRLVYDDEVEYDDLLEYELQNKWELQAVTKATENLSQWGPILGSIHTKRAAGVNDTIHTKCVAGCVLWDYPAEMGSRPIPK